MQGGNLLIPLHGYPAANAPSIPRRVDFGRVPIGERAARRLPLRCRIPMDFEFTVRVTKRSDAFSVAPAAGVVPAGGAAEVEVVFHPVRHQTEEMLFEVGASLEGLGIAVPSSKEVEAAEARKTSCSSPSCCRAGQQRLVVSRESVPGRAPAVRLRCRRAPG
jgi:hypothetical protein